MTDALKYEWMRIKTIRSTWWLSGIAATLAILVSFLIAFGISQAFKSDFPPPAREVGILAQIVVSQASAYGELGAPFLLPYVLGMLGVFTWVAMAVTSLVRNQTGAIVIMLVWPLVIENVVQAVFFLVPPLRDAGELLRFLPFEAGKSMLSGLDVTGDMFGDPLSQWTGFIVFGLYAAALMAASFALFHKRDA